MMKKSLFLTVVLSMTIIFMTMGAGLCNAATISAAEYKAGDAVTITGNILPGQDLFIAISSQKLLRRKTPKGSMKPKDLKKTKRKKGLPKMRQYRFCITC